VVYKVRACKFSELLAISLRDLGVECIREVVDGIRIIVERSKI